MLKKNLNFPVRQKKSDHTQLLSFHWFVILIFPYSLGLIIFIYLPLMITLRLSFFAAYNTMKPTSFVVVKNYLDLLHNKDFFDSLKTFSCYSLYVVPLTYCLAFALALLLHRIRWGKILFRTIIFLPISVSCVAAAIIWKISIFNGVKFGIANLTLHAISHHPGIPWLYEADPPWYWLVIISLRIWLQTGFYVILFLAGLSRIDPSLYEAAELDGVNSAWHKFKYITFPSMRNISAGIILLLIINSFQAFDEFYNLLGSITGYPPYARPPLIYLYYTAMGDSEDFGHAGAGAIIILLIIYLINSSRTRISTITRYLFTRLRSTKPVPGPESEKLFNSIYPFQKL